MLGFLGSLVGAGSSLLGGLMGSNAADKQAEANNQMQLDFAQNGLSWKAGDATRAQAATGINRLALLGAPTSSYSNVVGGDGGGSAMSGAGQDIGRAIAALAPGANRKADLQNKLLEAQIANVNSDTVRNQASASRQVVSAPSAPTPLYTNYRTPEGDTVTLPSREASSSLQNGASYLSDAAIMGDMTLRNLGLRHPIDAIKGWAATHGWSGARGDVGRYVAPDPNYYSPF